MRRLHLALLVFIASPAFAQNQQSVPRAIQLPDTMGHGCSRKNKRVDRAC